MKKTVILLSIVIISILSIEPLNAQKVDNIRIEKSGDLIRIGYNILDSRPGEIYRVRVLYSIDGGINTEVKSISGDAGDKVQGGKAEYWAIWDVLKDLDEIGAADFIVRAELVKGVSRTEYVVPSTASSWEKRRFNVILALMGPGPKTGLRFGYSGNWGLSMQLVSGKTEKGYVSYTAPNSTTFSAAVTKRILNMDSKTLHMLLGVATSDLVFRDSGSSVNTYSEEAVAGPEFGVLMYWARLSASFAVAYFGPGQIEKGTDLLIVSPSKYISLGIGVRF